MWGKREKKQDKIVWWGFVFFKVDSKESLSRYFVFIILSLHWIVFVALAMPHLYSQFTASPNIGSERKIWIAYLSHYFDIYSSNTQLSHNLRSIKYIN